MPLPASPPQLSTPFDAWSAGEEPLDTLVIGSGYGGSVAALRLAEAGHPVVLVERGGEFLPGDFPNDIATLPKYLRAPAWHGRGVTGSPSGLFEWHLGAGVASLTGNGLGGGSLINAGVLLEPDADVLQQACWPRALSKQIDAAPLSLAGALERARAMLGGKPWPDALPKSRALMRIAPLLQKGATAEAVTATIDPERCTRCGDCATGCNVEGAKLTLRDTYLQAATRHGAQLVTGATAYRIRPSALGWSVMLMPTERLDDIASTAEVSQSPLARWVTTRRLIVAAGTFGSTELLQRSVAIEGDAFELSPALGSRFSGNGDALSFLVDEPEPVLSEGHGTQRGLDPVGPTITRVVDLRRSTGGSLKGQPLPMEQRLVVEDGATPGALLRLTREMLATAYSLGQSERWTFRAPHAAPGSDPLASGAMAAHTQVLLSMGHDGSAGRLVRLEDRDTSVPWWPDDPVDHPSYRRQAAAFAAAEKGGGVHLHPPSWQLMPPSADRMMSGPKAERFLLTVHPLGGCPMGDDVMSGVVDHRGRVWRPRGEGDQRWWPGLHVLDGAIVPSSLGVNPLLTITALAERAMAHLLAELPQIAAAPAVPLTDGGRGGRDAHAPAAPKPFAQAWRAEPDISLFERLVCAPAAFHARDGRPHHAELRLELGSREWWSVWDSAAHRVELRRGRLRLQAAGDPQDASGPPATIDYEIRDGWFELLPAGRWSGLAGLLRGLPALLVLLPTWFAQRGLDDIRRALRNSGLGDRRAYLLSLLRGLLHAAERRTMRYRLDLQRRGSADAPERLLLLGRKRIGYAAGVGALLRWGFQHGIAAVRGRGVPPPRPTFWEQITDPQIVLLDDPAPPHWREWLAQRWPRLARAWGSGRFEVDAAELLAQAPLLLHRGDLTGGLVAQAAYPMLFLRYALKTHLLDFRLPDYSGRAVHDACGDGEVLQVNGQPCMPRWHTLTVRRGRSEGEDASRPLPTSLALRLWHYRRGDDSQAMVRRDHWYGRPVWRARSVLLLHAFGQSGAMFTLPSVQPNLAQQLLAAGFDVWILEHRISTRLPYTEWPSTIDQIARFDIPEAVDFVLGKLREGPASSVPANEPLQLFCFAQCIGAAALAMSLLDGRLSHDGVQAGGERGSLPIQCPKLAGAVISQTHPFLVGSPITRAKTWIPGLLRNALNGGSVPLAVRGPVDNLAEAWIDRVLASLPVPADEHCPHERSPRHRQDDCATCRRIRFIEAPLFLHRNLSDRTHADLPRLFGPANLQLFAHAALCVEHERLVDNDGRPVYVHDERMRRHFGLPIAFLHGAHNQLFDVASARRSATEYARLFPDLAARVQSGLEGASEGAAWIVDGFAHVDVVIGKDAPQRVFEPMTRLFQRLWDHVDDSAAPPLQVRATARAPRAGPWIGDVQRLAAKRWQVRIAFLVDDRFSEGKAGPGGAPGTRTWAWLRCGRGDAAFLRPLELEVFQASPQQAPGYRIAHGSVELGAPDRGDGWLLRGFTVHEALASQAQAFGPEHLPLPATLQDAAWCTHALTQRARAVRKASMRSERLDPAQRKVSAQRREARELMRAVARLPLALLNDLPEPSDGEASSISFAAAACRYPGMAIDALRVDAAPRELLAWSRGAPGAPLLPRFALLLGDQIYADATAGLVDEDNPLQRFAPRHMSAMAQGRRDRLGRRDAALGDLLAGMPVYFTQDDHEFRDGWPGSGALEPGQQQDRARDRRVVRLAKAAVRGFQQLHMPGRIGDGGSYTFDQGPVRFFVLDTRSERDPSRRSIFGEGVLEALREWFHHPEATRKLNCLVSGSVVLPRLAPGNNPSNPGEDTMAWGPRDRGALLELLGSAGTGISPRRFLLLSGDYHLSAALTIRVGSQTLGAAVVAPSLYAPLAYTNATREALWVKEDLSAYRLSMEHVSSSDGSGFAALMVKREASGGWHITLQQWLQDHAAGAGQATVVGPVTLKLE